MFNSDYITDQIDTGNFNSLYIYASNNEQCARCEEGTQAELHKTLETFLKYAHGGTYTAKLQHSDKTKRTGPKTEDQKPLSIKFSTDNDRITGGADTDNLIKELNDLKLKEKIREIEESNISRGMKMLTSIGEMILSKNVKPMTGPTPRPTQQESASDQETEFAKILQRWAAADPECIDVITAIVNMAENEPEKYLQYRKFLV